MRPENNGYGKLYPGSVKAQPYKNTRKNQKRRENTRMISKINRKETRQKRHLKVRNKISGTAARPRLCVSRSNRNIITQVIDDVAGVTLVSASTLDKEIKTKYANKEAAKEVGALVAKRALEKNIKEVVFDRGGHIYHGVVKEVAEAAREGGLVF